MICQTRFKVAIVGLLIGLLEGLLTAIFPAFPVIATFSFQGTIITGYFTLKTVNNVKREKFNAEAPEPGGQG